MALALITEALARLEHKVDIILRAVRFLDTNPLAPMHFVGAHACPVCQKSIDYQIDITHGVVKRVCDCRTGKVPSLIPLLPLPPGVSNGNPASGDRSADGEQARDAKNRR